MEMPGALLLLLLLQIFTGDTSGKPSDTVSSWVKHYDKYLLYFLFLLFLIVFDG